MCLKDIFNSKEVLSGLEFDENGDIMFQTVKEDVVVVLLEQNISDNKYFVL